MPEQRTLLTREEVIKQLQQADTELGAAIKRHFDGEWAFKCSIPARPEHDTDLILSRAISNALAALLAQGEAPQEPAHKSRSIQRREAIQRGEPMPTFGAQGDAPQGNRQIDLVCRSWNQIAYHVNGEERQRTLTLSTPKDAEKVWDMISTAHVAGSAPPETEK